MLNWLIKVLGKEDYYFVVPKNSEFNTTGKVELHTLNSASYVKTGLVRSIIHILLNR